LGSIHQESEIQDYSFYILSVGGITTKAEYVKNFEGVSLQAVN